MPILRYPDPRLLKVAAKVERVDDGIRKLIKDMGQTMYAAPGVGLAATQVDVHKRIIVVDISDTRDQLHVLINPEIVAASGEADCEEGCLSVPGVFEKVRRAQHISVRALNASGEPFTIEAQDLLAVCIQHEMDHLDGKVFVEYLSRLKQSRILAKLRKLERKAG
jgi:peptide deformylase